MSRESVNFVKQTSTDYSAEGGAPTKVRVNRSAGRKPLAAQMSPFTSTGGVPNKLQMIAASKGQVKSAERPATDARTKLVADVMLAAS